MATDKKPPTMCEVFNTMWEDSTYNLSQLPEEEQRQYYAELSLVIETRVQEEFMKSYHMLFALQQKIQAASTLCNASSETA